MRRRVKCRREHCHNGRATFAPIKPMNAKSINKPVPALAGHHHLCSNNYNGSDTYYLRAEGKSGVALQWGETDKEWGYWTMSQLLEGVFLHLEAINVPVTIRAAIGAAALAIDRDHVEPPFLFKILGAMQEMASKAEPSNKQVAEVLNRLMAVAKMAQDKFNPPNEDQDNQDNGNGPRSFSA